MPEAVKHWLVIRTAMPAMRCGTSNVEYSASDKVLEQPSATPYNHLYMQQSYEFVARVDRKMPLDRVTATSTNATLHGAAHDSTAFLRGLYYLSDVVRYLRATDLAARGDTLSLSHRLVAGWGRRGLITLSKNEFEA